MPAFFDPDDEDMFEEEAAEALGVTPGTMKLWRSKGRGPRYRRVGKRVTYTLRTLKEFREAQIRIPELAEVRKARRAAAMESLETA